MTKTKAKQKSKQRAAEVVSTQTKLPWQLLVVQSLATAATAIAIFLGGQIFGAFIVSLIGLAAGIKPDKLSDLITNNDGVQFLVIFLIEAITVWFVYLFLKRRSQTLHDIGLSKKPGLVHLWEAAKGYIIYFAIFLSVITIASALGLVDANQTQQIGFENPAGSGLVFAFLSLVILPPVAEEVLFRGFLYKRLSSSAGRQISAFVTSALFATAHLEFGSGGALNYAAALDTFVLSYVLIYVSDKTKSLWPAVILHTIKNGVAFVTLFVIK